MKKLIAAVLLLILLPAAVLPFSAAEPAETGERITWGTLLADMLDAYQNGGDPAKIDADAEALQDDVAFAVAEHWKRVYLDQDYRLFLYGTDDPAELPVTGVHAFVVLGYELRNGEMQPELKGRCDAAAAAAQAFPDSILVCSGGATGGNNPEGHTEAGLMRDYLIETHGISPGRIRTDERAMTTAENAVNTFVILQEEGVETMTIVTSAYHQRWGQVLYNALAAVYRKEHGYSAEIVGNFCYDTGPSGEAYRDDSRIAVSQLAGILGLSREDREEINRVLRRDRQDAQDSRDAGGKTPET